MPSNPFGAGIRPWARKTLAKLGLSTTVYGVGELLVDDAGHAYVPDGATQAKNLSPLLSKAAADSVYVAQVPTAGSYTYDGSGRITGDPDGNTYTYNGDDTIHTVTKGGVTRTATYGANGIASWA